jgi:hypothetical protein
VELLHVGKQPGIDRLDGAFRFQLYVVKNLGAPEGTLLDKETICEVRYPAMIDEAEPRHRRLPFFHRQTFRIEAPLPAPRFFTAPTATFDCRGLPAQREAVARLFAALERGDDETLLDDLALKFEAMERAYPDEPRMRAAARMREWREELLRFEPRPDRALELDALHFASRRGGQVVHVTRLDGRRVLEATCRKDPDRQILTDLVLIEHGGRWRVIL